MMRNILILIMIATTLATGGCSAASRKKRGVDPGEMVVKVDTTDYYRQLAAKAVAGYKPWQAVGSSGKLIVSSLPVKPTIKLHMVRDKSISLSARVPLLGEVVRIEIDQDSILAVDKMHRTYCRESMETIREYYGGALSDFQTLLLGRIVVFGRGELNDALIPDMEFSPGGDGNTVMVACEALQPAGGSYGYLLYPDARPAALMVETSSASAWLTYSYDKNTTFDVTLQYGKKTYGGALELEAFKTDTAGLGAVKIGSNYKELGVGEFVRQMGKI